MIVLKINFSFDSIFLKLFFQDNVIDVSSNVSALSESWNAYTEHELAWTVDIIEGILGTDAITTSRDAIKNTLQTINNVLYIGSSTLGVGESEYYTSSR